MSKSNFNLSGFWTVVNTRPDGTVRWVERIKNLIVDEGVNYALDAAFSGGTPITTWYVGLKNAGSPAAGDTLASHAGWTENTNYTGNRQAWVEAGVSAKSITNSASPAEFPINADSQTIGGLFLCSVATGTAGTLWAVTDFSSSKAADNGDTLSVTYTVTGADDGV